VSHGGARPGAGRKRGAVARIDAEAREKALASDQESPLDFLLRVMRDAEADAVRRLDAAKAAAPYVHAKLASIEVGNKDDKPFEQVIRWAQSDSEATPDPSKR
jgi:hypothetical protein